jgi:hypothetical protein
MRVLHNTKKNEYTQVMGLGTIVTDHAEKVKIILSKLSELIRSHFRIVIIIAAAFLLLIVLLLILAVMRHSNAKKMPDDPDEISAGISNLSHEEIYSEEEFFLPYEPNFVPDVLLEREPKDGWSEEDARPFWTDPLEGNREFWRKRIQSGIDSLLENVP